MNYNLEIFLNGLKDLNLNTDKKQIEQFLLFYELLIEKNKYMNLTAITEFDEVVSKHFLDSLSFIKAFNENDKFDNLSLIDIGTGGGFPGIPLKIVFPDLKITLLDSLNKRVVFLNEVIEKLELKNIDAVHFRAEDAARLPEFREKYDLAVSRAVANVTTLLEYDSPFLKIGGKFISYKSDSVRSELDLADNAMKILGVEVESIIEFKIYGTDIGRTLVVFKKEKNTPDKYPRKAGVPLKKPL